MLLSIVILTHNDSKYLDGCLASITEQVSVPHEVIVFDNGSVEDVAERFSAHHPAIRFVRSDINLGFNAGYNRAIESAAGELLLLLNVDTELLTDLAPATELLLSDPRAGVVGARSYGSSGEVRPSAGKFPRAWRLLMLRQLWATPKKTYRAAASPAFRVDWVEGSFLMTTAENWKAVGGFDEKNALFGNDIDFCRSTVERGLAVVHCPDIRYRHFGGYVVSRTSLLYAGLRGYHRKFSGRLETLVADSVLRAGLFARVFAYGAVYSLTRRDPAKQKFERFVETQRSWAEMSL